MKKLAILLTFVFAVATIAPAFAADPVKPAKKEAAKTECTKDAKGGCAKDCKKACCSADAKKTDAKVEKK
jgi:hypothetical protein